MLDIYANSNRKRERHSTMKMNVVFDFNSLPFREFQICSYSWKMLNSLLGDMERMRLLSHQIYMLSSSAASILKNGVKSEIILLLPDNLAALEEVTANVCRLGKGMESSLEAWLSMIAELIEVSTEAHSLSQVQEKEAQKACTNLSSKIELQEKEKRMLQEQLHDYERYTYILKTSNNFFYCLCFRQFLPLFIFFLQT